MRPLLLSISIATAHNDTSTAFWEPRIQGIGPVMNFADPISTR
jgi:hypothetical protein